MPLFFFSVIILALFPGDSSALTLNAQARILAGKEAHSFELEAIAVENTDQWLLARESKSAYYYWSKEECNGVINQLNKQMPQWEKNNRFLAENLSEAYDNTRNVFYPFGGPDFCYPDLFFPNMENLILVGQEKIGFLPNVQELVEQGELKNVVEKIGQSMQFLPFRSYFITVKMQEEYEKINYGIATLLLVSLALSDYQVEEYQSLFLDQEDDLHNIEKNPPSGFQMTYRKNGCDIARKIYYFNFNLLKKLPSSFINFIRKKGIDTSFFKATSFHTQNEKARFIKKFALDCSTYIVQGETGIPYMDFDFTMWNIHLFGVYARPYYSTQSISEQWGLQQNLRHLYLALIAHSDNEEVKGIAHSIWGEKLYNEAMTDVLIPDHVSWEGLFPFRFDYGGTLTKLPYRPYTTAVQYAIKKR